MRWVLPVVVLLAACASPTDVARDPLARPSPAPSLQAPADPAPEAPAEGAVTLLFGGDVMLGRGVALAGGDDPSVLLEGVRDVVARADLAVANLESPLTTRPHQPASGPNALEADPASAALLAAAGFDAMGVANNHAGDAGPQTVSDTLRALAVAGLAPLGGGATAEGAFSPWVAEVGGLRVALLAFDATGVGPRAGPATPGVAWWDQDLAREAVTRARALADVVVVGLHGGVEYVPATDPAMRRMAGLLARWGVDVVWGHGPHVIQPVRTIDPDGDGRPTVVATSLGNLLFDQHLPGTRRGALLEVLAGADGVRAVRVGTAEHTDGPARFRVWRPPAGDAVLLDGGWWALARPVEPEPIRRPADLEGLEGDPVDAAVADLTLDGRSELAVAFRRPYRPTEVNALVPDDLVDALGRTAHVGLYRPGDLRPRWVAGTLLRPVGALAPCDGVLAVAYTSLDDDAVLAASAWRWGGFGFVPLPELEGSGTPACADVDGDGLTDPLILGRSPR